MNKLIRELTIPVNGEELLLDVECPRCGASGDPCTTCGRTGFILTDAGRAFVRLYRRHILGDGS